MPNNHRDVFQALINWIVLHYPILYTFLLTMLIAFLRLIYDGVGGSKRFVEAILCGFIALAVSAALEYFGFPDSLAPFVGGVIGFFGIEKIRETSNRVMNVTIKDGKTNLDKQTLKSQDNDKNED